MNAICFKYLKCLDNPMASNVFKNHTKKFYSTLTNNKHKINTDQKEYYTKYIELRSDVKTIPTKKMLENIQNCFYGDDCFNEDPTTNKLLERLCALFQKESALFVPSGTMGNMACLSLHAERGDFIIQGLKSHIYKTEMASQKLLGFRPLTSRLLDPINPTAAKFDADHQTDFNKEQFSVQKLIENYINSFKANSINKQNLSTNIDNDEDYIYNEVLNNPPKPKAIALENTHNYNGGVLLDMKYFKDYILPEKTQNTTKNIIPLHLDGSRILNASVASNATPATLTADFDTVNICLSKALGAPCGSVIFFENKNYEKAKGIVKALGGGMRQNGVLAAAALIALEDYQERFEVDHSNAKILAEGLNAIKGLNCSLPQSNIVNVYVNDAIKFEQYIIEKHNVLTHAFENGKYIRCVLHHQVNKEQVYQAIKAFEDAAQYFQKE